MSLKNKKKLLIILLGLFLLIILSVITNYEPLLLLDRTIQVFSNTIHSPFIDQIMISITKIGNTYESLLIFIFFSLFLISKKKKLSSYFFTIITSLGIIIPEIIKLTIKRIRPVSDLLAETGYSFPSGHATISTIFLISSFLIIAPNIKDQFSRYVFIICTTLIFPLIALSRIFLSVHWFSDVLGGILLGFMCYLLTSIFCCQKKENML
ncbi:MAG: phosphatase PAP2 family protein [Candidatus Paceibacterota bacterium]